MTHFKINHERCLEWSDLENTTFLVALTEMSNSRGESTHPHSNTSSLVALSNALSTIGHFTIKAISQFDLCLETGIDGFLPHMKLVNVEGLRAHLDAHSSMPVKCVAFEQILEYADDVGSTSEHSD